MLWSFELITILFIIIILYIVLKKKDTLLFSIIPTFTMGKYGRIGLGGTMVKVLLEKILMRRGRFKNQEVVEEYNPTDSRLWAESTDFRDLRALGGIFGN